MAKSDGRPITRKLLNCPIFGAPRDLFETVLPTAGDILKYYLWVKHDLNLPRPCDAVAIISEKVASKTEQL